MDCAKGTSGKIFGRGATGKKKAQAQLGHCVLEDAAAEPGRGDIPRALQNGGREFERPRGPRFGREGVTGPSSIFIYMARNAMMCGPACLLVRPALTSAMQTAARVGLAWTPSSWFTAATSALLGLASKITCRSLVSHD